MPRLRSLLNLAAPLVFLLGLACVLYQLASCWNEPAAGGRHVWLAGKVWLSGGDPYSGDYPSQAAAHFESMEGAVWLYPPNWLPFGALLSLLDPLTASRLWLAISALLALAASALNVAAFQRMRGCTALAGDGGAASVLRGLSPRTLFLLHACLMTTSYAAAATLSFGQPSIIVYFGASLLVFAVTEKRDIAGAAGLALVMLVPQIGLMLVAALALSPHGRRIITLAVIACFLSAVPALLATPAADIAAALFAGAAEHQRIEVNPAPAMTGLRHLVWVGGGPDLGAGFYLVLTLAAVCAAGLAGRRRTQPLRAIDTLMIALAATLFLAPLHVHDFMLIGAFALYGVSLRTPAAAAAAAAGLLLIWRAGDLIQPAALASFDPAAYFPGVTYATIGAGAMLIGAAAAALSARTVRRISPARPSAVVIPFTGARRTSSVS